MPEVKVYYKIGVSALDIARLCKMVLPLEVASALTVPDVPEANLFPDDIEVHAFPVGPFDVQEVDVAIVVEANDYPPRREKLEKAKDHILEQACRALNERKVITTNVWVRLAPGAFGGSK